ncbi:MAG TPA: hypothetical protein DCY35_02665 [Prolixibacteraceae bacterium]|nr:hypothetical protein [Prolixibacteraceae bacterium]
MAIILAQSYANRIDFSLIRYFQVKSLTQTIHWSENVESLLQFTKGKRSRLSESKSSIIRTIYP